ncbi:SDR family oxidoreductase, partial [Pedobacter alluvionis]
MVKTIAIIGAGPGVGFAVAKRFGKEGYNVALLARSEEKLNDLVKQLEAQEISVASFYADVLDRNSLKDALVAVKKHFGSIDVIEFSPTPSM